MTYFSLPSDSDLHLHMDGPTVTDDISGVDSRNTILTSGVDFKGLSFSRAQSVKIGSYTDRCYGNLNICDKGLSISFWLKKEYGGQRERYIWSSRSAASGVDIWTTNSLIKASVITDSGTYNVNATFGYNIWTHVVLVWNTTESTLRFYTDSELSGETDTASLSTESFNNTVDSIIIGKRNDGRDPYIGKMDDFLIWERVITNSTIENMYASYMNSKYIHYTHTHTYIRKVYYDRRTQSMNKHIEAKKNKKIKEYLPW